MSLTNTTFPFHNPASYAVTEHDINTCPPDLWPMIKAFLAEQAIKQGAQS